MAETSRGGVRRQEVEVFSHFDGVHFTSNERTPAKIQKEKHEEPGTLFENEVSRAEGSVR